MLVLFAAASVDVESLFSRGAKSGKISFFPLETKKTTIFAENLIEKSQIPKYRVGKPPILTPVAMGFGRIFSRGGSRGFSQNFFQGEPKVVKFVFYPSKL